MKKIIGITTVARNISIDIQERFKHYLLTNFNPKSDLTLEIYIPTLDSEILHNTGQFSISKSKNSGIRKLIEFGCEVVICTDIDVIIPPILIEHVYYKSIQTQSNIFVVPRYINNDQFIKLYPNWNEFCKIPLEYRALGMWNCMTSDLWIKSGGWPEELYEWGFEDDVFRQKLKERNIETINITSFPLLHINHPVRNVNQMYSHLNNVKISTEHQELYSTNWL